MIKYNFQKVKPWLSGKYEMHTCQKFNLTQYSMSEPVKYWGSVGKDSAWNAGEPSSIPGSQRSPGEGIGYPLQYSSASPCGSACKESACNAGDLGSIPRLGRSPRERKGCILAWRIPWTV